MSNCHGNSNGKMNLRRIQSAVIAMIKEEKGVEEDEMYPEWDDGKEPERAGMNEGGAGWVMMRMTSHFLEIVQPLLQSFVEKNAQEYYDEKLYAADSSKCDYTVRQQELYGEYVNIFERAMISFQDEYSKPELLGALKETVEEVNDGKESMGSIFISLLDSISDFQEFDMMMIDTRDEK